MKKAHARIIPLPSLAGKSALNTKSPIFGVNDGYRLGVKVRISGTPTVGKVALKYAMDNSAYPGTAVAELELATAGAANELLVGAIENGGTNAYLEITQAFDNGATIAAAEVVVS